MIQDTDPEVLDIMERLSLDELNELIAFKTFFSEAFGDNIEIYQKARDLIIEMNAVGTL